MKRTQLYIDLPTYYQARELAKLNGQTISELLRESLTARIKKTATVNSLQVLADFAKQYPSPKGTPTDISEQLDHYLYGTPKKKLRRKRI